MEINLGAFLSFFLLGLALNLTPCVYPMLSVTVSLFGSRRSHHPVEAFLKALVYVLGMAAMYTALGAAAALTGGFFGAALQSKAVLLGLALLFFVLSLSLFGVYSVQAPGWLLARLGQSGKQGVGWLALFLYGLAAGLFAAPCIGPPVIALMAHVGAQGDVTYAVLVFFVLALGLGFPYLLIGTFSSLLHRLPRSGVWLLWVDHLFGTVLLGVSGFYACLAIYPAALAFYLPAAIAAGGIYLGFIDKAGDDKKAFASFKRALGMIFVILAAFFVPMNQGSRLAWEPYTPEALTAAKTEGRPVFLEFYAEWCIPCHELDRYTFSNKKIQEALEPYSRLHADLTNPDSETSQALLEQFNIQGVPTLLFLDANGEEVTRVDGFIEARDLLKILSDPRLAPKLRPDLESVPAVS